MFGLPDLRYPYSTQRLYNLKEGELAQVPFTLVTGGGLFSASAAVNVCKLFLSLSQNNTNMTCMYYQESSSKQNEDRIIWTIRTMVYITKGTNRG